MRIVQINTVPNGSTGTIMMNIHNELLKRGHESYVVWGRGRNSKNDKEIYMNDKFGVYFHLLYARITGKNGFASKRSTKILLKKLDEIKPDIIHLHNIHGYYINIELLFDYIKERNVKVVWTLHDCWAFTGNCSYFDMCGCKKWKKYCNNCVQKNAYPKSLIDNSKWCFNKKKELFCNVKNLNFVTPSIWLSNLVKESYLKSYDVSVINNEVNRDVFKIKSPDTLRFRNKYNLTDKKIILGVASPWSERKGLKDFIKISKELDDSFRIVLVGLSDKQLKDLPANILGLKRTSNVEELVDIYNSADVFFNPTYEENYPTVNLEAEACGLPVVTYDTGGSKETLFNSNSIAIPQKDVKAVDKLLKVINNNKKKEYVVEKKEFLSKYLKLYNSIYNKKEL